MDPDRIVRFFVSIPTEAVPGPAPAGALAAPRRPAELAEGLREIARRGCRGQEQPIEPRQVDKPSDRVIAPPSLSLGQPARREVIAFQDTVRSAEAYIRQLQQGGADIRAGIDLPIAAESWWCPGQGPSYFGDRGEAERLIRAEGLRDPQRDRLVNIVIVDQGLPADFPFDGERDGWTVTDPATGEVREPFQGTGRHAAMVARNALAYAKNVKLWDCPLLPDRIEHLDIFLSYAEAAFGHLRDSIDDYRAQNAGGGSWVVVNAWGVWDTSQDVPLPSSLNYSRNINHGLNQLVAALDEKRVDQVFAAGNCGQFCPPARCGRLDRGPGRSIHGANSHPRALSVGAVRSDGLWVGYSAEGPGTLAAAKPDLCAPSLFRDVLAPFDGEDNSGTSAACGVAAGVVAAARARKPWDMLSPEELRTLLRENAAAPGSDPTTRSRFGAGILNAEPVAAL